MSITEEAMDLLEPNSYESEPKSFLMKWETWVFLPGNSAASI